LIRNEEPARRRGAVKQEQRRAGSFDQAAQSSDPILPEGFPSNPIIKNSNSVIGSSMIEVSGLLENLGIKAAADRLGWRINSISAGSIPERSGLLVGDIIEAFDEISLAGRRALPGRVDVQRLKIDRAGKKLVITLKP
jgi:hypothetical protein